MTEQDAFVHDPQVRYMRRVFDRIEKAQDTVLQRVGLGRLDERLRGFREMALKLFEKTWGMAIQRGVVKNEEGAATLYLYCLSFVLSTRGIAVPSDALPEHREIQKFAKEVLK
jgi:hypothetical protein